LPNLRDINTVTATSPKQRSQQNNEVTGRCKHWLYGHIMGLEKNQFSLTDEIRLCLNEINWYALTVSF